VIGIFDSGLGGMTVFRHLRALAPRADVLYLADQAHVPYGDRETEDLQTLIRANLASLESAGVDVIAAGCNTSCAVARRFGWPATRVPVLDIIEAGAAAAAASGARRFAVVATHATVRSGAYGDAIRSRVPGSTVQEVAAPALVPLIEGGRLSGPEIREAVAEVLARLDAPDAIVYGCTHYPLIDAVFEAAAGAQVARIDPALAQAERVLRVLSNGPAVRGGRSIFRTTGDVALFREQVWALASPAYRDIAGLRLELV
jgi:glutamate racemase